MMNTRIIAGTMRWGKWGRNLDAKACAELVALYVQNGVRQFDSANIYGDFTNERLLGEAFAMAKLKRNEFEVISKCGIEPAGTRNGISTKHYLYSKEYIIQCALASLSDLRTEYLDLFLLHRPSTLMHYDEIADAFDYLKREGLVKEFGVSNFTQVQLEGLMTYFPVKHNQISYSVFRANDIPVGFGQWMRSKGIAVSAYSPVLGYEACTIQQQEVFESLARKYNVGVRSLAISWLMKHHWLNGVVLGTADSERVSVYLNELKDIETEDYFSLLEAIQGQRVP